MARHGNSQSMTCWIIIFILVLGNTANGSTVDTLNRSPALSIRKDAVIMPPQRNSSIPKDLVPSVSGDEFPPRPPPRATNAIDTDPDRSAPRKSQQELSSGQQQAPLGILRPPPFRPQRPDVPVRHLSSQSERVTEPLQSLPRPRIPEQSWQQQQPPPRQEGPQGQWQQSPACPQRINEPFRQDRQADPLAQALLSEPERQRAPVQRQNIPQQRGPPQQHFQQQQPNRRVSDVPPQRTKLKSLWNFVEQGLDELVNLEDQVSSRAKQVFQQGGRAMSKSVHQTGLALPTRKLLASVKTSKARDAGNAASSPEAIRNKRLNAILEEKTQKFSPLDKQSNPTGGYQTRPQNSTSSGSDQSPTAPRQGYEQVQSGFSQQQQQESRTEQTPAAPKRDSSSSPNQNVRQNMLSQMDNLRQPISRQQRNANSDKRARPSHRAHLTQESGANVASQTNMARTRNRDYAVVSPLEDLLSRHGKGRASSLLSSTEKQKCRTIGRSKAVMDVASVALICTAVRRTIQYIPDSNLANSFSDFSTLQSAGHALVSMFNTWTFYIFVAASFTLCTSSLQSFPKIQNMSEYVGSAMRSSSMYGQLYLRLLSSIPVQKKIPEKIFKVASAQVAAAVAFTRLRSFSFIVLLGFIFSIISSVGLALGDVSSACLAKVMNIKSLKDYSLRVDVDQLVAGAKVAAQQLEQIVQSGFSDLGDLGEQLRSSDILPVALQASVVAAVISLALLPTRERRQKAVVISSHGEDTPANVFAQAEDLSGRHVSSATRLNILSLYETVERFIGRHGANLPHIFRTGNRPVVESPFLAFRRTIMTTVVLGASASVYYLIGWSTSSQAAGARVLFDPATVDLSICLLFTVILRWHAVHQKTKVGEISCEVEEYLSTLSEIVDEVEASQQLSQGNMQQLAALQSQDSGIAVSDLWVAHTSKRAWAVRGANIQCQAGEVLVVLGDDGSGKTRLLTALGEAMLFPPRSSRSTSQVRGTISIGGVDVFKCDRLQLKRKLGLVLNDVHAVSDISDLSTDSTLREILEPTDPTGKCDVTGDPVSRERNAISLALKISGLDTALLPRLPTKLSTVVTTSGKNVGKSIRAPGIPLSPAEWSKTFLAKVLAQTIYDNSNQGKTADAVDNCLMGSLLILDDVTNYASENEEARMLKLLRKSGAVTIMTCHRWSAGQFADRVAVVKDGAIVENGTHKELLSRGPQKSIYAARWHAMTVA